MRNLLGKTSVCIVLLMVMLAGVAQAAFEWTDASGDHDWNNPANWNQNTVPDDSDWAHVDMLPGAMVTADTPVQSNLHIGRFNGNEGAVTVDNGAWFKIDYWLTLSRGADATLTVNSGTVGLPDDDSSANLLIVVGHEGGFNATLNMNGGLIQTQRELKIGNNAGSNGHVNLHGGVIDCAEFEMDEDAASHTMDVTYGTLIVDGDQVSYIQGFIDSGDIISFGSKGTFELDYDVRNPGQTTLTAVSPLAPIPSNGQTVEAGPVTLEWSLGSFEPNEPGGTISCDVFYGTDPNSLSPNYDFDQIVFDSTQESAEVTADALEVYFWQVIVYDDSEGPDPIFTSAIFTFNTLNVAPEVDAGEDTFTWLADGSAAVALDGTVTDDGLPTGSYTVEWTNVSDPSPGAVVFDDATSEDTTATFTVAGTYTLQLEADDGGTTGADTIVIEVYEDSCAAAQADPEYTPIDGDINSDCRVDLEDVGILSSNWLLDNSLSN